MKRYMFLLVALLLLTVPLLAGADDQGWLPPEWNPSPSARQTIDLGQLMQLLVTKGVISNQEYAQLTQPQPSAPVRSRHVTEPASNASNDNPVLSSR